MEIEKKALVRDEISRKLFAAMREKSPLPPDGWSRSKLDNEISKEGKEYETSLLKRQRDVLSETVLYLVDFAARMPERVNLTESNERVNKMCALLSIEIEKIPFSPNEASTRYEHPMRRIVAILSVQTCLIYQEETARFIARRDETKSLSITERVNNNGNSQSLFSSPDLEPNPNVRQLPVPSAQVTTIRRKENDCKSLDLDVQPTLF